MQNCEYEMRNLLVKSHLLFDITVESPAWTGRRSTPAGTVSWPSGRPTEEVILAPCPRRTPPSHPTAETPGCTCTSDDTEWRNRENCPRDIIWISTILEKPV